MDKSAFISEGRTYNKCIAGNWGLTEEQSDASLYFGSGWTEFCRAFSSYLVLSNLYWAAVPGMTSNEFHTCSNTCQLSVYRTAENLTFTT